jgi:ribosomal protein L11 methyltransferase
MPCPYAELYIYQLEGRMDGRTAVEGQDFLGHWQEEESAFLFFSAPAAEAVAGILRRQPHLRLVDRTQMAYDQWQGDMLAGGPIGRFRIIPSWQRPEKENAIAEDTIPILLDPGLVFGSGAHATTRNCLNALELAAGQGAPATVLDLGTGTGILALAAARLGGQRIMAVDLNPLAARTAWRNVQLNALERRILVVQGRAEEFLDVPADLLAANIHGEVMLRIMETPGFRRIPRCILSGLLRSEAKEVRRRLSLQGMGILEEWIQDGVWHTYFAERKQATGWTPSSHAQSTS